MTHLQTYWIQYVFAALAITFIVLYFKRGGGKGVFLGGRIRDTIGETKGSDTRGFRTVVRVHTLDSADPSRAVAMEIATQVMASLRWTPVTLTADDARVLAQLLSEAADKSSNNAFNRTPLRGAG